jgi:hypothetical protein
VVKLDIFGNIKPFWGDGNGKVNEKCTKNGIIESHRRHVAPRILQKG